MLCRKFKFHVIVIEFGKLGLVKFDDKFSGEKYGEGVGRHFVKDICNSELGSVVGNGNV